MFSKSYASPTISVEQRSNVALKAQLFFSQLGINHIDHRFDLTSDAVCDRV